MALTAGWWQRLPARPAAITGWAGLALILLACAGLSATTLYPGIAALLPTVGAALVIGAGCSTPVEGCGRVLAVSPMRAIGRISYSWYLWHWPVLVLAPALIGHPLGLVARVIAALVSGGLAVLTLRFVENPLRFAPAMRRSARTQSRAGRCRHRASGLRGLGAAGCGAHSGRARCAGRGADFHRGTGVHWLPHGRLRRGGPARVRPSAGRGRGLRRHQSRPVQPQTRTRRCWSRKRASRFNGCLRNPFEGGQPECATGDTTSSTTVALVGDSHAAMWTPALQQLAAQRHWRLEMLAKGACPLLDLPIANPLRRLVEDFEHCEQWRAQIIARLHAEHPRLIVLSLWRGYGTDESLTGFKAYDSAWISGLTRLVQQLRGTGAEGAGARADPGSTLCGADLPVRLSRRRGGLHAVQVDRGQRSAASRLSPPPPSRRRAVRRRHRPVLHRRPLPGHRRQHPGLPRRESPDARILPAVGPGHRGAGRPCARPRLPDSQIPERVCWTRV